MLQSPILIVDDDEDDLMIIKSVIEHLDVRRPVKFFKSGKELIADLKASPLSPFLILCDVNLPGETGFDIKKSLDDDEELKYKSVPFIFWSTLASEEQIKKAYDLPAQGFFFKPNKFEELCEEFETILKYWKKSQHPKTII